jgi:hypothetical protein
MKALCSINPPSRTRIEHSGVDSRNGDGPDPGPSVASSQLPILSSRTSTPQLPLVTRQKAARNGTPLFLYGQCFSPDSLPRLPRLWIGTSGATAQQHDAARKFGFSSPTLRQASDTPTPPIMKITGVSQERSPVTLEKGENVICMSSL